MPVIDLSSCGDILDAWPGAMDAVAWGEPLGQDWPQEEIEQAASQWAGYGVAAMAAAAAAGGLLGGMPQLPARAAAALSAVAAQSVEQGMWCARLHQWMLPGRACQAPPHTPSFDANALACMAQLCMHKTLGAPMFTAVETVSTHAMAQQVAGVLARSHAHHATLLWEVLEQAWARAPDRERDACVGALGGILSALERAHHGSAEALDVLAEQEVQLWADAPSLGHLLPLEYAAMFYHTLEQDIFPGLQRLGLDPYPLWAHRPPTPQEES